MPLVAPLGNNSSCRGDNYVTVAAVCRTSATCPLVAPLVARIVLASPSLGTSSFTASTLGVRG